jgi:hypothetical protein
MKIRNIIYAGAAMIFAACSNSDSLDQTAQQVPLTINATIDGEATRMSGNAFETGDKINVLIGDATTYTLFSTEDGTSFTAENPVYFNAEKIVIKAYYPYDCATDINTAEQSSVKDILYAAGTASILTGSVDLTFRHLMAKLTLKFSLGEGYSSSIDDTLLTDVTVTGIMTTGTFTAPGTIETKGDKASIVPTMSGAAGTCLIIPQETESLELTATYDGNEYAATVPVKGGKLEANMNYIYSVKIDKEKLTVSSSSSVAAWDVEEPEGYVDVIYSGE